jgi:hypothetical protein
MHYLFSCNKGSFPQRRYRSSRRCRTARPAFPQRPHWRARSDPVTSVLPAATQTRAVHPQRPGPNLGSRSDLNILRFARRHARSPLPRSDPISPPRSIPQRPHRPPQRPHYFQALSWERWTAATPSLLSALRGKSNTRSDLKVAAARPSHDPQRFHYFSGRCRGRSCEISRPLIRPSASGWGGKHIRR